MNMIEVKTAELSGSALDWAVAKAIKWIEPLFGIGAIRYIEADSYLMMETPDPDEPEDITKPSHFNHYEQWSPSRIWSQGGPLIEKHMVGVDLDRQGLWVATPINWTAETVQYATTPLIAACRAIVADNLGDTVQVPADLMGGAA